MNFITKHYRLLLCLIPIISLCLHFHVFSSDLVGIHVWRQTQTQNVINNFYRDDMNILNPRINADADTSRILRLEFPVMQWLFAWFYKLFGLHIIISRVLSFVIGMLSVWGMYYLCNVLFRNAVIAAIAAWCFNFSPLFYYYTMNPMPDNMAMCCGIWSLGFLCTYIHTTKMSFLVWSAFLLGVATLAKLPFILYGSFFVAFLFSQSRLKERSPQQLSGIVAIYALFISPAIIWYAMVIPAWHTNMVLTGLFEKGLKLGNLGWLLWGDITSVLPELMLNYGSVLFFVAGFYFMKRNHVSANRYFFPLLILGVTIVLYFLFEINTIAFVHDYYLLPFLPLVFLLVAYGAYPLLNSRSRPVKSFALLLLLLLPATAYLRADSRWSSKDPGFPAVFLHYKEQLRALTPADAYCIVGNDPSAQILLYYIDRKGWAFNNNELDEPKLCYYMSKGAKYLFSSSNVDRLPGIAAHLGEKIFDKETLRIYKLK